MYIWFTSCDRAVMAIGANDSRIRRCDGAESTMANCRQRKTAAGSVTVATALRRGIESRVNDIRGFAWNV